MMSASTRESEDVLAFWFAGGDGSRANVDQMEWWFRGGADAHIVQRFTPSLERAASGALDGWSLQPRSRLALIIVLDQFSRTIHRGTPQAFAQDARALSLALEGIENGHYAKLATPWQKTFFVLPLGHSEELTHLESVVKLAEELASTASDDQRKLLEFSANQARGHRDVIARFGRHPHRNAVLGRESTADELEYLASGQLVHTRSVPR